VEKSLVTGVCTVAQRATVQTPEIHERQNEQGAQGTVSPRTVFPGDSVRPYPEHRLHGTSGQHVLDRSIDVGEFVAGVDAAGKGRRLLE
jgi:hypothetical protein